MNPVKAKLAQVLEQTGVNRGLLSAQSWARTPYLRCVNYHDVPIAQASNFERQLAFFAQYFSPVSQAEFFGFVTRTHRPSKPGLVLTFDDGLRSHAEVVAPLLEKYGFTGWFMVPVGFVDADDQVGFARENRIHATVGDYPDGRIAMSAQDVRALADRHVIGCHTYHHRRLSADLSSAELETEILGAKARLEEHAGREVFSFCWVGGEESSYSASAARMIREAGFRLSFMTNSAPLRPGDNLLHIQRTHLEAWWPDEVVHFQVSGIVDVLYTPKRRRVNRLTRTQAPAAGLNRSRP